MGMRWDRWKVQPCISASKPLTPYSRIPAEAIVINLKKVNNWSIKDSCLLSGGHPWWCLFWKYPLWQKLQSWGESSVMPCRSVQVQRSNQFHSLYFWCDTNQSEKYILFQSSMLCILLLHNLQLLWAPRVDHQVRYIKQYKWRKESKVTRSYIMTIFSNQYQYK